MTIPIGLQLYAVRAECARDLPGTLSAVAQMGYAGVEFAGNYGYTARSLRQMLVERGLACCGTHTPLDALLGDDLPRTVEFNLALGSRYIIVPSLPAERRQSRAAWLDSARLFTEIAGMLQPHGLRLGFNNHRFEFQPLGGELPWDLVFGHADPSLIMQLDVGHALEAHADPVAVLRRYPRRATTVHLAEYSARDELALLGEGDVPWREVLDTCASVGGTQWYIVEQERYRYPQLECARRCLVSLQQLLK